MSDHAIDGQIRTYIRNEIKEHGHASITMRELADTFGCSISTVHKSLHRQINAGKIITHPGRKGCYHEAVH